jgi:hypothetical protein
MGKINFKENTVPATLNEGELVVVDGVTYVGNASNEPSIVIDFNIVEKVSPSIKLIKQRSWLDTVRQRAIFDATRIKRNAGIPSSINVGNIVGSTVGLSNPGVLVGNANYVLNSEANASSASSSGTGTETDPYIIQNKELDNSEAVSFGIILGGTDSYYIKFRNCLIYDYVQLVNFSANGVHVEFENCEMYNTASTVGIVAGSGAKNGSITCTNTLFSGMEKFALSIAANSLLGEAISVKLYNCKFDDSRTAWGTLESAMLRVVNTPGINISIEHCHIEGVTTKPMWAVKSETQLNSLHAESCKFRTAKKGLFLSGAEAKNVTGKYLDIEGQDNQAIYASYITDSTFENCNFGSSALKSRLVEIYKASGDIQGGKNVTVRYSKFTQNTGDNSAGSECCEAFNSKEIYFHDNYCDACPEDSFELVNCFDSEIYNIVAENVTGQIVDLFAESDGIAGRNKVHHIYGSCDGQPVILTDNDDVICHDIYASTTASNATAAGVVLEQRNYTSGECPNNCHISGPLPLSYSIGSEKPFLVRGTLGVNNSAIWEEDGEIMTFGNIDDSELVLK